MIYIIYVLLLVSVMVIASFEVILAYERRGIDIISIMFYVYVRCNHTLDGSCTERQIMSYPYEKLSFL